MREEKAGIFRRGVEWLGHLHLVAWLLEISHASTIAALAGAAAAGYWAYATQWGYLPIALTSLGVFVLAIWGINGVVWLRRQNRPSRARLTFDYSYGLVLETVEPAYDKTNAENTLEFRLHLRNHATGPVQFNIESFHITIGDRFFKMPVVITGILSRMEAITIFPGGGFKSKALETFGDIESGSIDYSILYGHPDDKLSRRSTKTLHLDLFRRRDKEEQVLFILNYRVVSQGDSEISDA